MSENFLRLIPIEPLYVPTPTAQHQALNLLTSLLQGSEIQSIVTEDVSFIDPGSNVERIHCSLCDTVVSMEWWSQAMDWAYSDNQFRNLNVIMPCCTMHSSLNDLRYQWPAGFARFFLEARSPGRDLTEQQVSLFEPILECPVRKIWTHL